VQTHPVLCSEECVLEYRSRRPEPDPHEPDDTGAPSRESLSALQQPDDAGAPPQEPAAASEAPVSEPALEADRPQAEGDGETEHPETPGEPADAPVAPGRAAVAEPLRIRLPPALALTIGLQAAATLLLAAVLLRDFEPVGALWDRLLSAGRATTTTAAPATATPSAGQAGQARVAIDSPLVATLEGHAEPRAIPAVLSSPSLEMQDHARVTSSRVDLTGRAPYGELVALVANDELVATSLVREGRFRFDKIELRRGDNTLSVIAWSRNGPAVASPTLRVRRTQPAVRSGRNLIRGDTSSRRIALTFDGGSTAHSAEDILDVLAARGVRCTVFLTGQFIEAYPELTRRIVAEGHEAGNHTWNHPHLADWDKSRGHVTRPSVSKAFLQGQLRRTETAFERVTGRRMVRLWRAPYGEVNNQIMGWAEEAGWKHVGWTQGLDALDWVSDPDDELYRSPEEIRDRIMAMARAPGRGASGGIVLMHLGVDRPRNSRASTVLGEIIDGLDGLGYQLVRVSSFAPESARLAEAMGREGVRPGVGR
jgi:peptidoglycan/xylan/chitin deacetylase (PgdA/CDA1 family)